MKAWCQYKFNRITSGMCWYKKHEILLAVQSNLLDIHFYIYKKISIIPLYIWVVGASQCIRRHRDSNIQGRILAACGLIPLPHESNPLTSQPDIADAVTFTQELGPLAYIPFGFIIEECLFPKAGFWWIHLHSSYYCIVYFPVTIKKPYQKAHISNLTSTVDQVWP